MNWKIIIPIVGALLCAAPATLAEDTKPGGSSPFKQYTCDQKHSLCIERCLRTGDQGAALNRCQESCAGKWLKCKGAQARTGTDVSTTQPEPTRK